MTVVTRNEITMLGLSGNDVVVQTTNGYTFETDVEGRSWPMGVCKAGTKWRCYDLLCGLRLGTYASRSHLGFDTRREALEYAESDGLKMKLRDLVENRPHELMAKVAMFEKVKGGEGMTQRVYDASVREAAAMMREGTMDVVDIAQMFGTREAESDDERAAEVATEITLSTMRAAVAGWENVAVTQEKPQSLIWVRGDTKEHSEELDALGFSWSSGMKGWWVKPTAATW